MMVSYECKTWPSSESVDLHSMYGYKVIMGGFSIHNNCIRSGVENNEGGTNNVLVCMESVGVICLDGNMMMCSRYWLTIPRLRNPGVSKLLFCGVQECERDDNQ